MAVNPDKRPLPPGWAQHFNNEYQTWFYVSNGPAGSKTQWNHPAGDAPPPPAGPPPGPPPAKSVAAAASATPAPAVAAPPPAKAEPASKPVAASKGKKLGGLFSKLRGTINQEITEKLTQLDLTDQISHEITTLLPGSPGTAPGATGPPKAPVTAVPLASTTDGTTGMGPTGVTPAENATVKGNSAPSPAATPGTTNLSAHPPGAAMARPPEAPIPYARPIAPAGPGSPTPVGVPNGLRPRPPGTVAQPPSSGPPGARPPPLAAPPGARPAPPAPGAPALRPPPSGVTGTPATRISLIGGPIPPAIRPPWAGAPGRPPTLGGPVLTARPPRGPPVRPGVQHVVAQHRPPSGPSPSSGATPAVVQVHTVVTAPSQPAQSSPTTGPSVQPPPPFRAPIAQRSLGVAPASPGVASGASQTPSRGLGSLDGAATGMGTAVVTAVSGTAGAVGMHALDTVAAAAKQSITQHFGPSGASGAASAPTKSPTGQAGSPNAQSTAPAAVPAAVSEAAPAVTPAAEAYDEYSTSEYGQPGVPDEVAAQDVYYAEASQAQQDAGYYDESGQYIYSSQEQAGAEAYGTEDENAPTTDVYGQLADGKAYEYQPEDAQAEANFTGYEQQAAGAVDSGSYDEHGVDYNQPEADQQYDTNQYDYSAQAEQSYDTSGQYDSQQYDQQYDQQNGQQWDQQYDQQYEQQYEQNTESYDNYYQGEDSGAEDDGYE